MLRDHLYFSRVCTIHTVASGQDPFVANDFEHWLKLKIDGFLRIEYWLKLIFDKTTLIEYAILIGTYFESGLVLLIVFHWSLDQFFDKTFISMARLLVYVTMWHLLWQDIVAMLNLITVAPQKTEELPLQTIPAWL